MANERVVNLLVRVQRDKVAADLAQKMVVDLRQEMARLEREAKSVTKSATPISTALKQIDNTALRKVAVSGQDAVDALNDMAKAAKKADNAVQDIDPVRAAAQRSELFGDIASRGTAVAGLASSLGGQGVGQGIMVGADLFDAVEGIQRMRAELPALSKQLLESGTFTKSATSALQQFVPGMSNAAAKTLVTVGAIGAMVAATAAMAIAVNKAKDIIKDSAKVTNDFIDVNERYAELIATSTTQNINEAIKKNVERNKALEIEREKLQLLVDMSEETEGFAGALLDANDALGLNLGGQEDAKKRLEEVNTELNNNIGLNDQLRVALEQGATAAADLAAREVELRAERKAFLDDETQRFIKLGDIQATWTGEQLKAEQERLQREIQSYETQQTINADRIRNGEAAAQYMAEIEKGIADEQAALNAAIEASNTEAINFHQGWLDYWKQEQSSAQEALATGEEARVKNDELTKSIEGATNSLADLDLAAPIIAARDASKAATDDLLKSIDDRVKSELDAYKLIQTASSEQVQSQIDTIKAEQAALEEMRKEITGQMESGTISFLQAETALAKIGAQTIDLTQQAQVLSEVLKSVELREWAENFAAMAELTAQYFDDVAKIQADRDLELARDAEDFARDQVKEWRDLQDDLLKLDQDYAAKRADLLKEMSDIEDEYQQSVSDLTRDYDKEAIRQAEDHRKRLADIQRDTGEGIEDAIAERNIAAAIEAVKAGKKRIEDETEQYAEEQKLRQEELKDQLDQLAEERDNKLKAGRDALSDLERQHDQERIARMAAYAQQLQDETAERAIRLQRQQEDWAREDSEREVQYQKQLTELQNANAMIEAQYTQHFLAIGTATETGMKYVADTITGFWNSIMNSVKANPGSSSPTLPTPYASGGDPPPGSMGLVGEKGPEWVMFQGRNRVFPHDYAMKQGGGKSITLSMPVTISGADMDKGELVREIEHQIIPKITSAIEKGSSHDRTA